MIETWEQRLCKRIARDSHRDPLDAQADAELLHSTLKAVKEILDCPGTRYVVKERLIADLATGDLDAAVECSAYLLAANRQRSAALCTASQEALLDRADAARTFYQDKASHVS